MWSKTCNVYVGSENKYHKGARDGNVLLLREGTKRDFNKPDDDGMTPVHWAAFDGKLEALRIITGRGGNPDTTDVFGNTALHHAVRNNHLSCVSYLINFGCNLWALDNDGHSALDLAGIMDHGTILRYLDAEMSCRASVDPKKTEKLKSKAVEDVKKRLKESYHRYYQELRNAATVTSAYDQAGKRTITQKFRDAFNTVKSAPTLLESSRRQWRSTANVYFNNSVEMVQRPESNDSAYDHTVSNIDQGGLFERPGFGTVSFRNLDLLAMFPNGETSSSSVDDCSASSSSGAESHKELELNNRLSDQKQSLYQLLDEYGVAEYAEIFEREKITIDSFLLLSETDLIQLQIPMGPRKILVKAILDENNKSTEDDTISQSIVNV